MKTVTINLEDHLPDTVLPVEDEFRSAYDYHVARGREIARRLTVTVVGMARNIGGIMPHTIRRVEQLGQCFRHWRAVVVENDSIDDTKDVLMAWEDERPGQVVADCRDLGREHLHGFERARVERYAEYRNRYLDLANGGKPDYVLAVDMDPWGGWSLDGILSSLSWLTHESFAMAGGMASTSLYQATTTDGEKTWAHYDQWAFRQWSYAPRFDPYFLTWLPPPGTPPIRVFSAFGACCLYRGAALRTARYVSENGDIEHVGLHHNMATNGWEMYLNPASRVVMHWHPT